MEQVIWIEHQGILKMRTVYNTMPGVYRMISKGKEYWFRKEPHIVKTNFGWHEISDKVIPDEYFTQIARQLEAFEKGKTQ